jgi:murein DD-endopeptidase MepM/ murein hydrolase activator NlpD
MRQLPRSNRTTERCRASPPGNHPGPGGTGGFSSRHVVVRVRDPNHGVVYNVFLHLSSIDAAVTTGVRVTLGQRIGTVGDDDATYPHLHMEFRKGRIKEIGSVHLTFRRGRTWRS